jgi:hypothetical protein
MILLEDPSCPTIIGPLSRAYYFVHSRLNRSERLRRQRLFGTFRDGLRPNRPYQWQTTAGTIAEGLRLVLGHDVHGLDTTIYGLLLVLFIIFMPKGILGAAIDAWKKRRDAKPAVAAA